MSIRWRANRLLVPVGLSNHEYTESKCDEEEEHAANDDANNGPSSQFFRLLDTILIILISRLIVLIVGVVSLRLELCRCVSAHGPHHVFAWNVLKTLTAFNVERRDDATNTVWPTTLIVLLRQIVIILCYGAIRITYNCHLKCRIRLSLLARGAIPNKVIVLCNGFLIWLFNASLSASTIRKILCAVHPALTIDSVRIQRRKDA